MPTGFHLVNHPLVEHKLGLMRDKTISRNLFRHLVHELSILLYVEATRKLSLEKSMIDTPLETCEIKILKNDPLIIPILRAGLGMVEAFLTLIPTARVGHIGLARNEVTHQPDSYYFKIPKVTENCQVFLCDPMLATGGSAIEAINALKQKNINDITLVSLLAAPEGVERLLAKHPDLLIYCAGLDRELNEQAYILPGLGDAGDRLFGTDIQE